MSSPFTAVADGVRVAVRALPRAGANAIVGVRDGRLVVKVTAAPEDGKANAALIKLLSKSWHVPAGSIELINGEIARDKTLLVRGVAVADLPL